MGVAAETSSLAEILAAAINHKWPATAAPGNRFVVCTGGEPLLQLDKELIDALHACNFEIAVETNGTIAAPAGLDWICVSPKAGAEFKQRSGDELKLDLSAARRGARAI
jgi:7-carboxy-7-deazaguanine synthase